MKKNKVIAVAALALCALAAPVMGQTTNNPTDPGSFLVKALSLHDPSSQQFTNNIELEFQQAAVIDSTLPGTMQATTLGMWKRVGTDFEIGGDGEVDTLGVGQDVSAVYGHLNARLDWDNIAGGFSLGGGRQIDLDCTRVEGGLLAEYRLTKGIGTQLRWYTGWQDSAATKKGIYTRVEMALTVALGK